MSLCERCGRTLDKQRDVPFKSTTDEIISIQAQVRRVEQEVERLTAQRVLLQRRLNAIAASTVTLPYEIISTIFQHACPPLDINNNNNNNTGESLDSNGNTIASGSISSSSASGKDGGITYPTLPFKLAAVCSQWRDIALSTPQLWTSVAFNLYQSRTQPNADALETFFQRSGSCEVAVSLIFASGDEGRDRLENDMPPSLDVLKVFLKNSLRWGKLKVDGLPPEWIAPLRAAQSLTPTIQQLWLCPYDNSREQQMVDIFSEAPKLRRVTLDNTFLSAITLPWTGLTHLKVSWVSIDECAEMLRRCPNLLECDFQRILSNAEFHALPGATSSSHNNNNNNNNNNNSTDNSNNNSNNSNNNNNTTDEPPITLPYLHTLKWSYAGDAWEFQLFERIHFPSLRHLKMKLRYDLSHFHTIQDILVQVLSQTSPLVERVDFDLGCPWVCVGEILRCGVPRVREVRLVDEHDPEFVRGLMGALVGPGVSGGAGPVVSGGSGSARINGGGGGGLEETYGSNKDKSVFDNNGEAAGSSSVSCSNSSSSSTVFIPELFLPELRSLEFQGNNPTDFQFPKLVVEQLSKRWDKDTEDLYAIEVASSGVGKGASGSGGGGGGGYSSSSSSRPRCNRARLENVNLELTSEVYVDGLAGQGGVVKEGLNGLMKAGMKVRIMNGFDGKTWL